MEFNILWITLIILFNMHRYCVLSVTNDQGIPPASDNHSAGSTILTICFILENDSYFTTYSRVVAAVELGVLHANSFVLPKPLVLQYRYQDVGTACTMTMYSVVEKVYELLADGGKCDLFLGPTCSHPTAALYGFANHFDVPLFGIPSIGAWSLQGDTEKKDFPLLIQPAFGAGDLANFITDFLRPYQYRQISIFRDDSFPFFGIMVEAVTRFIRERNAELFRNVFLIPLRSRQTTREGYTTMLRQANDRSRVFFLFVHATAIRELMISAYFLGFTEGEHVYLTVELYDLDYWGRVEPVVNNASTDAIAAFAYQSLLVIAFEDNKPAYNRQFEREVKVLAREQFNYTFNPLETIDPVITAFYEAVIIYATVVSAIAKDNGDFFHSGSIIQEILNRTFVDYLGGSITIGVDGQRSRKYCIKYYNNRTHLYEQIFLGYETQSSWDGIPVLVNTLPWPSKDGRLPPNEPKCGFRDNKCIFEGLASSVLAAAVVVPILIIGAIATTAVFAFFKLWKARAEFNNPDWWKISSDDLIFKPKKPVTTSFHSYSTAGVSRTAASSYVGDVGTLKGISVNLTDVSSLGMIPNHALFDDVSKIRGMEHGNLQHFIGISTNNKGVCEYIVAEICSRGSLSDVLENKMLQLDWSFKNSFIRDLVFGMTYLHSTPVISHGHLSSPACLVDTRFTLKISQYGLPSFRKNDELRPPRDTDLDRSYTYLLWRSPELLRQIMPPKGTQKGDVYSFAIILQQIILRSGPFELPSDPLELSEREIVQEIISANIPPVRPRVPRASCSNELYDLMERSWEENPLERPTFAKTKERLRKILGNIGDNIVDLLFKRIEQYASDLEQKVADQTQQFMEEKNRSEQLLSQLLPKTVAASLTKGKHVDPEAFESVTIFFSDIVGFTTIAAKGSPMDVIDLLNGLYTFFDEILEKYDVYKVETIGDAYMVSSGLPERNGNKHVTEISYMALDLQHGISKFVVVRRPQEIIQIRAGINSGPCVAGIVGLKMPRYCLFGDTVNVASRMESTGEPMKIQIGKETKDLLSSIGGFLISERGPVTIKGKGVLTTFWLLKKENVS